MKENNKKENIDLRAMYNALNPAEQQAVINFFNLHNAAIWIFSGLSPQAVEYVNLCISLSQEKVDKSV